MTTPEHGLHTVLGPYLEMYRRIQERMGPGGDLGAESPHQTMNRYFRNGTWSADRIALHRQILTDARDRNAHKPRDGRAVLLTAGAPAAGKSSVLRLLDSLRDESSPLGRDLAGVHPIPVADFVTIDPDEFKRGLLVRPASRPELPRDALHLPGGHTLAPAEMAALVHAESRHLANQFALWAREQGYNLLYDSSLRTLNGHHDLLRGLQSRGYQHRILVSVEVPSHDALVGNATRWKEGRQAFDVGADPYGGRMAPEHYIRDLYPGNHADYSTGRVNARRLATDGAITDIIELDRNRDHVPETGTRTGTPLHRRADTTIHIRSVAVARPARESSTTRASTSIDTADRLRHARRLSADAEPATGAVELANSVDRLQDARIPVGPESLPSTYDYLDDHAIVVDHDAGVEPI